MERTKKKGNFFIGFLKVILIFIFIVVIVIVGIYATLKYSFGVDIIDIKNKIELLNANIDEREIIKEPLTEKDAVDGFVSMFGNSNFYVDSGNGNYTFDKEAFKNANKKTGEILLTSNQLASCTNVYLKNKLINMISFLGDMEVKQVSFSNFSGENNSIKVDVSTIIKFDLTSLKNEMNKENATITTLIAKYIPNTIYVFNDASVIISPSGSSIEPKSIRINKLSQQQSKEIFGTLSNLLDNKNEDSSNEISKEFFNLFFSCNEGLLSELKVENFTFKQGEDNKIFMALEDNSNANLAEVTQNKKNEYLLQNFSKTAIINLEEDWFTISQNTTYNGEEQKPVVTSAKSSDENELKLGVDYNVKYLRDNSQETTDFISAGNINLEITGNGNYVGKVAKTFEIEQASPNVIVSLPDIELFAGDSLTITNFLVLGEGSTQGSLTNSTIKSLKAINEVSWTFVPQNGNYKEKSGRISIPAYYETRVEFLDVSNVTTQNVLDPVKSVKFKTNRKEVLTEDLPETNYKIIRTRNNIEVLDFSLGGEYNVKVEIDLSTNYRIVGEDNVTFKVKPIKIYNQDNSFFAVNESGFDININLFVETYTSQEEILKLIGQENYLQLENIQKLFHIYLTNGSGKIDYPNTQIYHISNKDSVYYTIQNTTPTISKVTNGNISIENGAYFLKITQPKIQPFNITLIAIGVISVFGIIVLVFIYAKKHKEKIKEKNNKVNQTQNNQDPAIQDVNNLIKQVRQLKENNAPLLQDETNTQKK